MPPRPLGRQFMRAVINPGVALVLCSRAHRLLSGSLLLLTIRGRKTGLPHSLPVQYADAGGVLYVLPGNPRQKQWWRNLNGGAPIDLRLAGRALTGHAEALAGAGYSAQIRQGLETYFKRFPAAARLHGVRRRTDGSFDPEDLQHAAVDAVVVRIRPLQAA